MSDPNFVILYVESPATSAAFYADLLGRKPVESSAQFCHVRAGERGHAGALGASRRLACGQGARGRWGARLHRADAAAVDVLHRDWTKRGLAVVQLPTDLDFGRTFVALDPDGHRLRVFAPTAQ